MNTTITSNAGRMAERFEQRASKLPSGMRQALGQCTSLVFQKRKELIQTTIYKRGPERPFTYNLMNSEYIKFEGPVGVVGNSAVYAEWRGETMEGTSVLGYDKSSKYASTAVAQTASMRKKILKTALKRAMSV